MPELRKIREIINLKIYRIKSPVMLVLDYLSLAAFLSGIVVIINYFGFSHPQQQIISLTKIILLINYFFTFKLLITLFFDFNPGKYIIGHPIRSFLSLLMITVWLNHTLMAPNQMSHFFFDSPESGFLVQSIIFGAFSGAMAIATRFGFSKAHLNPAALLSLSFLALIATGATVLTMPQMTTGSNISLIDAIFTSTSASCVTGLIVQDTATFFSLRGQIAIMVLMQLGGLNMLIIASFIASLLQGPGSLRSKNIVGNLLDTDKTQNFKQIVRKVIYYSLIIEAAGTIAIYLTWGDQQVFSSDGQKWFFSLFHSVSAFNNAGFSLFSNGLLESTINHQYFLQMIIAFQIILGGLGFFVLQDIFSFDSIKQRRKHRWKKLTIHSRLVLRSSLILIATGTVFFLVLEFDHTLSSHSLLGKLVTSLFQSVTLRTAGFNTVDISSLTLPVLLLFMVFMFIGASPGSTGGGIKTTTFAVSFLAAMANIKGKEHVEVMKRNISWDTVNKTYAVIAFTLGVLFIFTFGLSITETGFSMKEIVFEAFSALGTVGLSMGITPDLSEGGKVLVTVLMYVGRLGSLTLGIALSRKIRYKNYRYPDAHLIVG